MEESKGIQAQGLEEPIEITDDEFNNAVWGPFFRIKSSDPIQTKIVDIQSDITMPSGTVLLTYSEPSLTEDQIQALLQKIIEM